MSKVISPSPSSGAYRTMIAAVLLVLATLAAYHNSFHGPFVYDDLPAIKDNPTILNISDLGQVLSPPNDSGITVNGRPLVNLSLAINYAIGGVDVVGYHIANLIIHLLAGLALFGLVRRTLRLPSLQSEFDRDNASLFLAFTVALLWMLHPLQTESVTYVIQRAESLVGLFYLLTFYCFVRSLDSSRPVVWQICTVAACLCGMGSKEVMASAPLLVLLYDRAMVSGTFGEAWRRRSFLYLGLAATWLPLAWLVHNTGNRGGTAGFGAGGVSSWDYALTSALAIGKYVKLTFWPNDLVFDYGTDLEKSLLRVLPQSIVLVGLVGATFYALWRNFKWGFFGIWFFAILGPSSSIIPVASETMAEHRMYLPLAAIIAPLVIWCGVRFGRPAIAVFVALGVAAGAVTVARNTQYQDEWVLWTDTLAKYPTNPRAHNNVGEIHYRREEFDQAIACFREAVRLSPTYIDALNNLGNTLGQQGAYQEALPYLETAFRLKPQYPETNNNLGSIFYHTGRREEAVVRFREALKFKPNYPEANNNLGLALAESGQNEAAIPYFETALKNKKDYVDGLLNYGNALRQTGRPLEAAANFEAVLRLKPTDAKAHNNLGVIQYSQNKFAEAKSHFEAALRTKSDYPDALTNLGAVLVQLNTPPQDVIPYFEQAIKADPTYRPARENLARVSNDLGARSVEAGDLNSAKIHFERTIRATPGDPIGYNNLGVVFLRGGYYADAVRQFEEALRLRPDYPAAQAALAEAKAKLRTAQP